MAEFTPISQNELLDKQAGAAANKKMHPMNVNSCNFLHPERSTLLNRPMSWQGKAVLAICPNKNMGQIQECQDSRISICTNQTDLLETFLPANQTNLVHTMWQPYKPWPPHCKRSHLLGAVPCWLVEGGIEHETKPKRWRKLWWRRCMWLNSPAQKPFASHPSEKELVATAILSHMQQHRPCK